MQESRVKELFYSKIYTVVSVITVSILVITSVPADALPQTEKEAIDRNSVHYKLGGPAVCESPITLSGDNNAAKAFNFFIDKGLTDYQSAGIVGNLLGESGLIPNRKQGSGTQTIKSASEITPNSGYGIAQWTSPGRQDNWIKFADERGVDPLSLELQLLYLWHELETVPGYGLKEIKAAGDLRQATWVFLVFFERPAATSGFEENPKQPTGGSAKSALDTRVNLAKNASNGSEGTDETPSETTEDSCESGGSVGGALDGNEEEPDFNKDYAVKYDGPPSGGFSPSKCSDGFTPGAKSLSEIIMESYSPPVTSVGGFDCRQNTNDNSVSIHGVGRALDIMIDGTTPKGKETGDRIRNVLINNAEKIGLQVVIWDRHIWSVNNSGWRSYNGPNPHIDHLHVEINIEASKNSNLGR